MALSYAIVSFVSPAAAGGTTTVPIGFLGKGAVIFGTRTAGTQGLAAAFRLGVDDGTNRGAMAINPGNFGAHQSDGYFSGVNSVLAMRTQGLNELMITAHVTFSGTDMIVHWNFILVATGVRFYALVVGGVNAKVIGFSPNSGIPASLSTTAVGFQPTCLIAQAGGIPGSGTNLQAGRGWFTVGVAGDILCGQGSIGCGYQPFPAGGLTNAGSISDPISWMTSFDYPPSVNLRRTVVASMDPLGFTVTQSPGSNGFGLLALDGCSVNVGTFTQPAGGGSQDVPITMAAPRVAIIMGAGHPANTLPVNDMAWSFGIGDPATQKSVWMGSVAGTAGEVTDCVEDDTHIGILRTPTGNFASTLNTQLTLTGLSSGVMSLNWPTVSGANNEWIYAIIGDDLGTGPCGGAVPVQCIPDPPNVPGGAIQPTDFGSGAVTGRGGVIV